MICPKGHLYDEFKCWIGCPYCEGGALYPGDFEPYECGHERHVHTPQEMFMVGPCARVPTNLENDPAAMAKAFNATPEEMGTAAVAAARPNWDTIWMNFAGALALRSTCKRSSVGCVVVSTDNSTVLGLGYNGGPKGGNNACLSDEPGKCGHLHAEINALIKANYRDGSTRKAYLTLSPCLNCATALVNFGVEEVIYRDAYRDLSPLKILDAAGVRVRQFDPARVPERDLYLDKDRKA